MAIDDVGHTPVLIAGEIHRQLGNVDGPVPVDWIARQLGIVDIQRRQLNSFEGALITQPERRSGVVLINSGSGNGRQRYTLAHELGHFLCHWHGHSSSEGFVCRRGDMELPAGDVVHVRQEAEANQFAIELLCPQPLIRKYLRRLPELEQVLNIHSALEISKTAAARRYVSLHKEPLAALFATGGAYQYSERNARFPYIPFKRGDRLPSIPINGDRGISDLEETDPTDWGLKANGGSLFVQSLSQRGGHHIILLHLDTTNDN